MNLDRLKGAEADFMARYPGGFDHPEMEALGRKHRMDKMVAFAQERFAKDAFAHAELVLEDMIRLVSRSSMISVFEKPKFRDGVRDLPAPERRALVQGLEMLLHGDEPAGFEAMLALLKPIKLAKWSLMTICQTYYAPREAVFIKPTTAKGVIAYFELSHLQYHPTPSWDFYQAYRQAILEMRALVHPSLSPSNAAFSGFLMMSLESIH